MPTILQNLKSIAENISAMDLESLVRPAHGAVFGFEEMRPLCARIIEFYHDVAVADFTFLPDHVVEQMRNYADRVSSVLREMREFDLKAGGDPNERTRNFQNSLRSAWTEAYNATVRDLNYAKLSSSAINDETQRLRSLTAELQSKWDGLAQDYAQSKQNVDALLVKKKEEFDQVLTAARAASVVDAVAAQAGEFDFEANDCASAARWWFAGTITSVLVSIGVVFWLFRADLGLLDHQNDAMAAGTNHRAVAPANVLATNSVNSSENHSETTTSNAAASVLQKTVARILIATLLYTLVAWCSKNYFAFRHNYTVNRHRRNAMKTFRAFVEGTTDVATRDFILRQAAACAFSPQQSGYLKDESLPAPSAQLIDLARPSSGKPGIET